MANPQKEDGHLDLANKIVEALAKTHLSSYESQILWVIWRKTYCWHKKEEFIKHKKFQELTEIKEKSRISETISRLVKRKIITKKRNLYGFNKDYDEWDKSYGKVEHELRKTVTKVTENRKTTPVQKKLYKRNYIKEREVWQKLIKHLDGEEGIKNPVAYLKSIVKKYGTKNLEKLLSLETSKWYENLDYWQNH